MNEVLLNEESPLSDSIVVSSPIRRSDDPPEKVSVPLLDVLALVDVLPDFDVDFVVFSVPLDVDCSLLVCCPVDDPCDSDVPCSSWVPVFVLFCEPLELWVPLDVLVPVDV